jgi:8-oxo-dGTP diphosphatase
MEVPKQTGWPLPPRVAGVAAIVQNRQGQVLLQQRDDKPNLPFAGYWTLPGGKVEDGETPEAAINRELLEEIELKLPLYLWKVYERPGPHSITIVQYVYTGKTERPISSLAVNEGQALQYFAPPEADRLPIAYGVDTLLTEYFATQ